MFMQTKIGLRLWLLVLVVIASLLLMVGEGLLILRQTMLDDRQDNARNVVETAYGVITHYGELAAGHKLDPEDARSQALALLRGLRYEGQEYFWVNTLDLHMVMHPIKPELDGRDMSGFEDPKGKRIFVEFAKLARRDGAGFVDYYWPKPGSDIPIAKVSYVKLYESWGWVIGSGVYLDDVDRAFESELLKLSGFTLVALLMIGLVGTGIKLAGERLYNLNRELRAISNCNQVLIRAEEEQQLLDPICAIICEQAGYRMAWVGYAEHDDAKTVRPVAWAGFDSGYIANARLSWAEESEHGKGPAGKAIRTGGAVYIPDFAADPSMVPWRAAALQHGYRSGIALPLKDEAAEVFGVLLIYAAKANAINEDECRLLEELAGDLAFGISALRTRAERKRVDDALRESSARYRRIVDTTSEGIWMVDQDIRTTFVNARLAEMLGYSSEEMIGRPFTDFMFESDLADHQSRIAHRRQGMSETYERRFRRKDGQAVWTQASATAIVDDAHRYTGSFAMFTDITERKRAEDALKNMATKFRTVYESSSDAIMLFDESGFCDCNRATLLMFNCPSRDDFIRKHPSEFSPPTQPGGEDSMSLSNEHIATAFRQGSNQFEWMHARLDGTKFPAEVWLTAMELDGRPVLQATVRDITERKRAEEALHRLNRELRAISNCNQVLVRAEDEQALLSEICRIVCDEAGYRMAWVGYAEHDEARSIRPVASGGIDDGYLDQVRLSWADTERGRGPGGLAIRTGEVGRIDDFLSDPRATPWVDAAIKRSYRSCIALPLKDESANTYGVFLIYSGEADAFTAEETRLLQELAGDLAFGIITLRARHARDLAEQKRQESETRLQLTLQATQIGIWDWDVRNDRWYASPVYYTMLGYEPRPGFGDRSEWMERVHPEDRDHVKETVENALSCSSSEYCYEARMRHADGSYRWQQVRGFGIERNQDGQVTRMLGTQTDINERRRIEAELQRYREHLEELVAQRTAELEDVRRRAANSERLAALGVLIAGMAHELNTPIGNCLTAASTIADKTMEFSAKLIDGVKRSDLQQYLDNTVVGANLVCTNLDRAAELVTKFKHISIDQICPLRHEFALLSVIQEAADMHMPDSHETRHLLKMDVPPDIRLDSFPGPLNQVLADLFSNALTHGLATIESGVVDIRARMNGDAVRITFGDNGVGMPPEVLARVFDPFFTTKFGQGSSGLGLYVAYNIVTGILGGTITVSSQEGHGCSFTIDLPVKAP